MTSDEIMRRLTVLVDMAPEKRPITIYRLEQLAKIEPKYIYKIVKHHKRINAVVCKRLGRVLELVENGQVIVEPQPKVDGKRKQQFGEQPVRIVDKKNPPQCIGRRVTFDNHGKPKVVSFVYNPAALQKS